MEIGQPAELIPIGTPKRSDSLVLSLDVIDFGANLNSTAIKCSLVGVLISLERAGGYHTGVIDTIRRIAGAPWFLPWALTRHSSRLMIVCQRQRRGTCSSLFTWESLECDI